MSRTLAGAFVTACSRARQSIRALIGTQAVDAGHEPAPPTVCLAMIACHAAPHDVSILIAVDAGEGQWRGV